LPPGAAHISKIEPTDDGIANIVEAANIEEKSRQ
jgi:hypothetical protein